MLISEKENSCAKELRLANSAYAQLEKEKFGLKAAKAENVSEYRQEGAEWIA